MENSENNRIPPWTTMEVGGQCKEWDLLWITRESEGQWNPNVDTNGKWKTMQTMGHAVENNGNLRTMEPNCR